MDHDKIVNKRVQRIARDHGCTVNDVYAALDRHPIELDRDTFLKRTLAMELVELDELQQAFREKALVDRDTAAGVLMVKIAERRSTLLGLNPPIGHAVAVIQHEPPAKKTSTQEIGPTRSWASSRSPSPLTRIALDLRVRSRDYAG